VTVSHKCYCSGMMKTKPKNIEYLLCCVLFLKTESHCVTQAGTELSIFLSQPSECGILGVYLMPCKNIVYLTNLNKVDLIFSLNSECIFYQALMECFKTGNNNNLNQFSEVKFVWPLISNYCVIKL
jgi:hypothetical protein